MASVPTPPLSLDFEVLYLKQREAENLKDAWYRLMESYRISNLKGDAKVLLRNFYIGLALHHRQLLDFAACSDQTLNGPISMLWCYPWISNADTT